nr:MAG TPA: hypothetical protein [Caudoviricetes sp.]
MLLGRQIRETEGLHIAGRCASLDTSEQPRKDNT